jgi:hypothetical protein
LRLEYLQLNYCKEDPTKTSEELGYQNDNCGTSPNKINLPETNKGRVWLIDSEKGVLPPADQPLGPDGKAISVFDAAFKVDTTFRFEWVDPTNLTNNTPIMVPLISSGVNKNTARTVIDTDGFKCLKYEVMILLLLDTATAVEETAFSQMAAAGIPQEMFYNILLFNEPETNSISTTANPANISTTKTP